MTYRCALGPGVAKLLGLPDSPTPRIICDGCGAIVEVVATRGAPPVWFLRNKLPPGWSKRDGESRKDLCPECTHGRTDA